MDYNYDRVIKNIINHPNFKELKEEIEKGFPINELYLFRIPRSRRINTFGNLRYNSPYEERLTCLEYTIQTGHTELVEFLIENGANNIVRESFIDKNNHGIRKNTIENAFRYRRFGVLKYLWERGNITVLENSPYKNLNDFLNYCKKEDKKKNYNHNRYININTKEKLDKLFVRGIIRSNIQDLQFCIDQGINIDNIYISERIKIYGKFPVRFYPLYYVCFNGNLKILKFLIKNGADVKKLPHHISYHCLDRGWFSMLKLLIENDVLISEKFETSRKYKEFIQYMMKNSGLVSLIKIGSAL